MTPLTRGAREKSRPSSNLGLTVCGCTTPRKPSLTAPINRPMLRNLTRRAPLNNLRGLTKLMRKPDTAPVP